MLFDIGMGEDADSNTCTFFAFGTVVTITAYGTPERCRSLFGGAVESCRAYERRLSTRLPHSDIARLNSGKGEACAIHPQTAQLLEIAKSYCARSAGVFDITVQPAMKLWDFKEGRIPEANALAEAIRHVDWRGLHAFQRDGQWFAGLDDRSAEVDLGGIAKGWISDRLVEGLKGSGGGIGAFSVNLGGNVVVRGEKPGGLPWRVGVRDPLRPEEVLMALCVRDCAVVTSGTYERCFQRDGRLFHHVLDPLTGLPVATDLASVTVLARDAIDAEGYSTTLLALGADRALGFARDEDAIEEAILVGVDGRVSFATGPSGPVG